MVGPEGVFEVGADDRVDVDLFTGLDRFFGRSDGMASG